MLKQEVLDKVFNEITSPQKKCEIITGFDGIDALLENNEKPSFITIGGRPSMGKTAFSISILLNFLEKGRNCLVFSNDTCETSYIRRLVAPLGEISLISLKDPQKINDIKLQKIKNSLDKISKYNLTINDNYVDISDIKEQIETIKPDYVFIDSIRLLAENITAKSFKKLKQIAQDNDCTIFALSELSRAPENRKDKRPRLSDLINAKDIVNASDTVMLLYRDSYYHFHKIDEDAKDSNKQDAEIIIAKNKGGPVGTVLLTFDHSTTKFSNPKCSDVFEDFDVMVEYN